MGISCAEVERDECQPDDASGVHREPNKLGFIEVLRYLPRLDGVDRADCDEDHTVHLLISNIFIMGFWLGESNRT